MDRTEITSEESKSVSRVDIAAIGKNQVDVNAI